MRPWQTLDRIETSEGPLELRQRGERDFLITIGGRVLMTSSAHRSEDALAQVACEALATAIKPRVLVGGLGMGYTLRAALDHLPADAEVDVVDLNERVIEWCRGPLAPLAGNALADRRVHVHVGNVAHVIARAPAGRYHAIIVDLYEGPHQAINGPNDPLYGRTALALTWNALKPNGVFAVWSEEPDRAFETRMKTAGFDLQRLRRGGGGRVHAVYLGVRARPPRSPAARDAPLRDAPRPGAARKGGRPRPPAGGRR